MHHECRRVGRRACHHAQPGGGARDAADERHDGVAQRSHGHAGCKYERNRSEQDATCHRNAGHLLLGQDGRLLDERQRRYGAAAHLRGVAVLLAVLRRLDLHVVAPLGRHRHAKHAARISEDVGPVSTAAWRRGRRRLAADGGAHRQSGRRAHVPYVTDRRRRVQLRDGRARCRVGECLGQTLHDRGRGALDAPVGVSPLLRSARALQCAELCLGVAARHYSMARTISARAGHRDEWIELRVLVEDLMDPLERPAKYHVELGRWWVQPRLGGCLRWWRRRLRGVGGVDGCRPGGNRFELRHPGLDLGTLLLEDRLLGQSGSLELVTHSCRPTHRIGDQLPPWVAAERDHRIGYRIGVASRGCGRAHRIDGCHVWLAHRLGGRHA